MAAARFACLLGSLLSFSLHIEQGQAFIPATIRVSHREQNHAHMFSTNTPSSSERRIPTAVWAAGKGKAATSPQRPRSNTTAAPDAMVGIAKALAKQGESRAAEIRQAKAQERAKTKSVTKSKFINPIDIPINAGRAARRALESLGKTEEPKPQNKEDYQLYFDKKFLYAVPTPNEKTPTILVVGATGETGRQVVKKLLFKGYRVQVLVRNLYSTTLNLLGTGVSYIKGDLNDIASLRTACDGVDKVVFVAQARSDADARGVEYLGLRNLAQAFQDTRITETGKRVTTKRTLFKFRKTVDKDVFRVVMPKQVPAGLEASWVVQDAKAGRPVFSGSLPVEEGESVALESKKIGLNLSKFGGLLMFFKAQGDAQTSFKFVIRTGSYASTGIEYQLNLPAVRNRFIAFRMNFKDFTSIKNGRAYSGPGSIPLDSSDVKQFGVLAVREAAGAAGGIDPAVANPTFSLTLEGIKVFRARNQPDLVVLSSSDISPQTALRSLSEMESGVTEKIEKLQYYRAQGELALKNSGLSYCIIRISDFTSSPTEGRPLSVSKSGNNMGLISRPDAAEVVINCLFNPGVCNTEIYASENPRYGDRDIQRLLNELFELPF